MGSSGSGHSADVALTAPLLPRSSQRDRLLDGMARAAATRGYAATSVADVLALAGVSRRTFYEQFADKEDCFLAAYDSFVHVATKRAAVAYRAAARPRDGLAHGLAALLGALAAEPDFARLTVVEVLAAGPQAVARRDALLRRFVRCIETTRTDVQGVVAPPEIVAQAIAGGMYELVYARISQGPIERVPELADELLQFAFMLLGAERPRV
jgi:AcrR family transcriptional regulator